MKNFEDIKPDDPILTAYALGEIDDEKECAALQEAIDAHPLLAEAVEDIRNTASLLDQAFAEESSITDEPSLTPFSKNTETPASSHEDRKTVRFPTWIALTAAAVVALMIGLVSLLPQKEQRVETVEMQFLPPETPQLEDHEQAVDESALETPASRTVRKSDNQSASSPAPPKLVTMSSELMDASDFLVEGEAETMVANVSPQIPVPSGETKAQHVGKNTKDASLTEIMIGSGAGSLYDADGLLPKFNSSDDVTDKFMVSTEQEIDFYGGFNYSLDENGGGVAWKRDSFTFTDSYGFSADAEMYAAIRSSRGSGNNSEAGSIAAPSRLRQNRMADPNCATVSLKLGEDTGVRPQVTAAMRPPVAVESSMASSSAHTGEVGSSSGSKDEVASQLIIKGRAQMLYGDLEGAVANLEEAEALDPNIPAAGALLAEAKSQLQANRHKSGANDQPRVQHVSRSLQRLGSFHQVQIDGVTVDEANLRLPYEEREPMPPSAPPAYRRQDGPSNTEGYDQITDNAFVSPTVEPLSTFSIDVDTASYANVRRFIDQGKLPPPDAVRIEELINYFPYDYAPPGPKDEHPIAIHLDAAPAPWAPEHRLVRIGLKAREVDWKDRPASNLVFLLDVSGSMNRPNKLPLVKEALSKLIRRLDERDRVAIVVYAGASGLVLPGTTANNTDTILHALDNLQAGGSTNGGQGIQLAYKTAKENFLVEGNNRIILCTDGDFNVGTTGKGELTKIVAAEAKNGVYLTVLGFGMGNFKDDMLETLSNKGNGNYGYIDSAREARKVFVEQATGTLLTVAKDVKIQVEFNPNHVGAYRLIGYENRKLAAQDFNDDKKDAGEVGAGHTVTALYEIIPAGQETNISSVDPLKYQVENRSDGKGHKEVAFGLIGSTPHSELLTAKLRYKLPDSDTSTKLEQVLTKRAVQQDFKNASAGFRFASAVAEFGMILQNSSYKGQSNLAQARTISEDALGKDPGGHRGDFVDLVEKAISIMPTDKNP